MRLIYISLLIMFIIPMTASNQNLEAVAKVDLNKYSGKWYEIASYPQRFQENCFCTTANYTITPKGYVIVENSCNKYSVNGEPSYIKGKAFVEENSGNAKLKVQFFWPFKGKYWIIELADDYSYAVVSHPGRKYLWILSRTPQMNHSLYIEIISRLKEKGFDVTKIKLTPQV